MNEKSHGKRRHWYVGYIHVNLPTWKPKAFPCDFQPTFETHGHIYGYVVGPFRTKLAALWAEAHPQGYNHVNDAEELSHAN